MKKDLFLIKSTSWKPSSFYNQTTQLIWVLEYKLFKKIYTNQMEPKQGYRYAIHKDVYNAFLCKFKHAKKTRKRMKK